MIALGIFFAVIVLAFICEELDNHGVYGPHSGRKGRSDMTRTIKVELTQYERNALVAHLGGRRSWATFEHGAADVVLLRNDRDEAIRKITEASASDEKDGPSKDDA